MQNVESPNSISAQTRNSGAKAHKKTRQPQTNSGYINRKGENASKKKNPS
jgi:hypothetical protein